MIGRLSVAVLAIAAVAARGDDPKAGDAPVRVLIQTEAGDIEVELDAAKAPNTVANFLKYVDGKFYDGGRFHRTVTPDNQPDNKVKIEVIQAGINPDRAKDGFKPIKLERTKDTGLKHTDGTISMARSGPDSATSDFFICIGDQPELDFGGKRNPDGQGFAAFGRVVKGMDVVKKIQQSAAEQQSLKPPVKIIKAVRQPRADDPPARLAPFFKPPAEFADDLGDYRSPLKFDDGTPVRTPADWQKRRTEILKHWHAAMGEWPPLIEKPKVEYLEKERRENFTQHHIRIETPRGASSMTPTCSSPTARGRSPRCWSSITRRGRASGWARPSCATSPISLRSAGSSRCRWAATRTRTTRRRRSAACSRCRSTPTRRPTAQRPWRTMPNVDPKRIGVVGHSYGGKWAMFASCLYEKFACRLVRPRHRLRREAAQRQLLGAVVPGVRPEEQRKSGASRARRTRAPGRTRR
jgi:peptidyl-prolyl cis-trans isomerase A (cyclophilin A)